MTIVKSLIKDVCENKLDEWLKTPEKYACIAGKMNETLKCASSFERSIDGKDQAQIASIVVEILTTGKHCDELISTKKCFNDAIKGCTPDEKKYSGMLINDLTSATGCVGLKSGAKTNSLSAFLGVVATLTLLNKCF